MRFITLPCASHFRRFEMAKAKSWLPAIVLAVGVFSVSGVIAQTPEEAKPSAQNKTDPQTLPRIEQTKSATEAAEARGKRRLQSAFQRPATGNSKPAAGLQIPPIPEDQVFVQDYANILSEEAKNKLANLQKMAFENNDVPIIVVTIQSMSNYGGAGYSIERFAFEWFNAWQISKRGQSDELINKGILLLVSVGDRKARIELGNDWGKKWDGYCAAIMNRKIVPQFKKGNYPDGIVGGVEALAVMSKQEPESQPPIDFSEILSSKPIPTSPLPLWGTIIAICGGIALIVGSLFVPDKKIAKYMMVFGIVLIASAILFWIALFILAMLFGGKNRGRGGGGFSGGGFSGGGFGGGGFSGGGGASGSW